MSKKSSPGKSGESSGKVTNSNEKTGAFHGINEKIGGRSMPRPVSDTIPPPPKRKGK